MDISINFGKHKIISLSSLYICCMLLLPILNQYKIMSFNFFDLVNIIVFFICIIKKVSINRKTPFFPYIGYTLVSIIIFSASLKAVTPILLIKNIISFTLMIFNIYFVAINSLDLKKAYQIYSKIVIVSAVIVVFEFIINVSFNSRVILVFPWATLNYGGGISGSDFISLVKNTYATYRASAFFLEPASFAEYALPWIYLSLFNTKQKNSMRNIFVVLFVTISVCLTTSSLGMLGCLIAWCIYVEVSLWTTGRKNMILILPLLVGAGLYVYNLDVVQAQIISKMYSLNDLSRSTSLSLRLFRGKYCFEALDRINQFFGCGYGFLYQYFVQNNITTVLDREGLVVTYMNGMSLMFCSVGIVGSILYLLPLISKVIRNTSLFMLLVCWILMQMTSQVFDTPSLLLLTLFIVIMSDNRIKQIEIY